MLFPLYIFRILIHYVYGAMVAMLLPDTLARQVSYAVVLVLLLLGILDSYSSCVYTLKKPLIFFATFAI